MEQWVLLADLQLPEGEGAAPSHDVEQLIHVRIPREEWDARGELGEETPYSPDVDGLAICRVCGCERVNECE